jgi:hypothetical protein
VIYVVPHSRRDFFMDRKEIVRILGEHLGVKPKYLGVPSFAYKVGDFTVTRYGSIVNGVGDEMDLDEILNPSGRSDFDRIEIAFPLEGHDARTIKNLLNMVYSKQPLIKKVFNFPDEIIEEELIEKIKNVGALDKILEAINEDNCKGINFDDEKITFTFIRGDARTSSELLNLLIKKAKELKHSSPRQIETDNDKYSFRTWLIRLGMIGEEYKEYRKNLLSPLTGNSAFRNGQPANGGPKAQ